MVCIGAGCSLLAAALAAAAMLPVAHSDMQFFQKICSETGPDDKDACLAMLLSNPSVISCNDLTCAAGIGAGVCLEYAKNTSSFIEKLKDKGVETPESMAACEDVYAAITDNLVTVIKQMLDRDYFGAWQTISHVTDPDKCETAFQAHPNPMTTSNKRMGDMLDVVWKFLDKITS